MGTHTTHCAELNASAGSCGSRAGTETADGTYQWPSRLESGPSVGLLPLGTVTNRAPLGPVIFAH